MKQTIKFLALTICILMLLSAFAACKKDTPSETESSESVSSDVTDPTESQSNIPAINQSGIEIQDMDGRELTIWYATLGGWNPYPLAVTEEEALLDQVNEAGYQRNIAMERDFNVRLKYDPNDSDPNEGSIKSIAELRTLWQGGDIANYDIVMAGAFPCATLAVEGFYTDLADYDVIKPDAPYYESQLNKQVRFLDHQFFASGFYSANNTKALEATFVNTKLLGTYSTLTVADLNKMAMDHKWTIEKLLELGMGYATPATNAGEWVTDQYAFIFSYDSAHSIYHCLGGDGIIFNEATGKYTCTLNSSVEQNLLTWIQDNLAANDGVTVGYIRGMDTTPAFINNTAPFMEACLGAIPEIMDAGMEYTILPPPCFEEGDDYNSFSSAWCLNFAGIPSSALDNETSAYLYEAFMCYSYDYIYPAAYEKLFRTQYTPDSSSVQVFDLIANSRYVSLINLYSLNTSGVAIKNVCRDETIGVGSWSTKASSSVATKLSKLIKSFNELNK